MTGNSRKLSAKSSKRKSSKTVSGKKGLKKVKLTAACTKVFCNIERNAQLLDELALKMLSVKKAEKRLAKAGEKVNSRELIVKSCVDRIKELEVEQFAYRNKKQAKAIQYLKDQGWKGSASEHPEYYSDEDDDEDELDEDTDQ